MKMISPEKALERFKQNSVCRKGITPYSLIIHGIITYEDWLHALKDNPRTYDEYLCEDGHNTHNTMFGKKVIDLLNVIGFDSYRFSHKFKKRSNDHDLEAIKLINITISPIYIDE